MHHLLTILQREFNLFRSNKIMIVLFFGAPVLLGLAYASVYRPGKLNDIPIIVIDKDHSPTSAQLIDMLEDNEMLTIKYVKQENVDIQDQFITDGVYGAVLIPPNFEHNLLRGQYTEICTYINNTNLLVSGYVNRSISAVVGTLNAIASAKEGKPEVIHLNAFRLFNASSNYLFYIWPSFLAIFLQAVILVVVAMSFATEMENNTLGELNATRLPVILIMVGKTSFYWILSAIVVCIYRLYFYLFRLDLTPHLFDIILITALFVGSLSFQGMIAGLIIKSPLRSVQFVMLLNMPAWVASGYSWPFDQDALPAQLYGILFPYMPFVNGFRTLLVEQGSLNDIHGYITLQVIQLLLYFFIAWLLLKFRLNRPRLVPQQ